MLKSRIKFFWFRDYAFLKQAVLRKAERAFIDFILDAAENSSFKRELHWHIHNFRKKPEQQQRDSFPAFYLFLEQFLFSAHDTSQQHFREALYSKFKFAIEHTASLRIIFLTSEKQVIALAQLFLQQVLEDAQSYFSKSRPQWLAQWENIVCLNDATLDDMVTNAHNIYRGFSKFRGERSALRAFNASFEHLQARYQVLPCFPELLKLFPERALDDTKFNLLSREQIKARLLDKVDTLEKLSEQLQEKNNEIELQNALLNKQATELDSKNEQLSEASMLIEMMNEELSKYNRLMEVKVRERTVELEKSNLLLQNSNQNLEQYTFAISHQLKAPVSRILGLANLATLVEEHERTLMLGGIKDCATELNGVLKDLVVSLNLKNDIANVESDRISLRHMLQKVWDECCKAAPLDINATTFSISGDAQCNTDARHFETAVRKIFENSIKFRKPEESLNVRINVSALADEILIIIADNGIGFDATSVHEKICMPFARFNLTHEGRGMGLYLSKHHINVLKGKLTLESEINKGTVVRITLPL